MGPPPFGPPHPSGPAFPQRGGDNFQIRSMINFPNCSHWSPSFVADFGRKMCHSDHASFCSSRRSGVWLQACCGRTSCRRFKRPLVFQDETVHEVRDSPTQTSPRKTAVRAHQNFVVRWRMSHVGVSGDDHWNADCILHTLSKQRQNPARN